MSPRTAPSCRFYHTPRRVPPAGFEPAISCVKGRGITHRPGARRRTSRPGRRQRGERCVDRGDRLSGPSTTLLAEVAVEGHRARPAPCCRSTRSRDAGAHVEAIAGSLTVVSDCSAFLGPDENGLHGLLATDCRDEEGRLFRRDRRFRSRSDGLTRCGFFCDGQVGRRRAESARRRQPTKPPQSV